MNNACGEYEITLLQLNYSIICVLRVEYNCFETTIFPLPSKNIIELSGEKAAGKE